MPRVRGAEETAELESVIVRVLDKEVGAYKTPYSASASTARTIASAILDYQEDNRLSVRWD